MGFFGFKFFVLKNGKENIDKFDSKVDEAIFLDYALLNMQYKLIKGHCILRIYTCCL